MTYAGAHGSGAALGASPLSPGFALSRYHAAQYPDYYALISNPLSLTCIQRKLDTEEYRNVKQLEADLRTVCRSYVPDKFGQ